MNWRLFNILKPITSNTATTVCLQMTRAYLRRFYSLTFISQTCTDDKIDKEFDDNGISIFC